MQVVGSTYALMRKSYKFMLFPVLKFYCLYGVFLPKAMCVNSPQYSVHKYYRFVYVRMYVFHNATVSSSVTRN